MELTNEKIPYILKEYLNYHYKYIEKYGENTVVLMQVGSFYEIYAVINDEINIGADVNCLGDILDIQVYRKNKNIEEVRKDSPCTSRESIRLLLTIASSKKWKINILLLTQILGKCILSLLLEKKN